MGLGQGVKFIAQFTIVSVVLDEEFFNAGKKLVVRGEAGGGVDFDAVAGGKDDPLGDQAGFAELFQSIRNIAFRKSEAFPQFHGRRPMAQTDDDDAHLIVQDGKVIGDAERQQQEGEHDDDARGKPPR